MLVGMEAAMIEVFVIWSLTVLNPLAALIMIGATLSDRVLLVAPVWHRLGMLVTAGGLLAQASRNVYFLATGDHLTILEMPFWIFKDYGIAMLAFHFAYLVWKRDRDGG